MKTSIDEKILPRNPLGIIALFVFLIEAIATVSLKIVADKDSDGILWLLTLFIIAYPTFISALFFAILWKKREVLYSPSDFSDPKSFENLLRQVERIEAKQDAAQIESDSSALQVEQTMDRLVELDDVYTAVNVARSFLRKNEFDKALRFLKYLSVKVPRSHGLYYRILSNLAYALIGKKDYAEAIKYLDEVQSFGGGKSFKAWHALAAAYSYHMVNDEDGFKKYLNLAKKDSDYRYLDFEHFRNLYPEIARSIK